MYMVSEIEHMCPIPKLKWKNKTVEHELKMLVNLERLHECTRKWNRTKQKRQQLKIIDYKHNKARWTDQDWSKNQYVGKHKYMDNMMI